jgi:hypothetical protein
MWVTVVSIERGWRARLATASIVLAGATAFFGPRAARADDPPPAPPEVKLDDKAQDAGQAEPKHRLPFLADEARKRGYDLPLPFGGALVLTRLSGRKIDVTDVRLALADNPGQSISQFLDLGSTSDVFNANLKFDAWLLPFLNVYALVGYVHNESTTDATVTLPRPGPIPGEDVFETEIKTELDGFIGGGGIVLAGGYKNFYFVGDASYVQTDLGFDDAFTALIATIRAGYTGKLADFPLQMWLGVGNWDTAATASGHGSLSNGARFTFEADQKPHTLWMYDIGANLEISKRFQLFVDIGFDFEGGSLFVIGPTYRF